MEAILIAAVLLAGLILYVYAVVDIHRYRFPSLREKAMWLNIVLFAPLAGPLLYFIQHKRRKPAPQKRFFNR